MAGSPFWIGTAADAGIRLFLPGIDERHVSILEREDGYWVAPARAEAPPRVNGQPAPAPRRLRHGDVLEVAPGVIYRFDTGAPPPAAPPRTRRAPQALEAVRRDETPRVRQGGLVDRKSRRARGMRRGAIAGAVALGVVALVLAVSTLRRREPVRATLSEADAAHIDSLMLVSYEGVERGTALLGMGMRNEALREFARAVNVLQASRWGRNEYVRPRVLRLEAAIAAVYRDQKIVPPPAYRAAASTTVPPPASAAPKGSLTQAEFASAVEATQAEFESRFARRITVTGRDHGEHLMLYGVGGAMDLRVRDLTREQITFAIQAFNRRGVRVKDFSDDRVLQAQVASALRRNRRDLMGTGLHLHIDRFANRWDRWTTK